jgi:hypothetical protein
VTDDDARAVLQRFGAFVDQFATCFGRRVQADTASQYLEGLLNDLKAAEVDASDARALYQDPKNGKTALHYGVEKEFDPTLLKWLVRHGASPDIADHDGVSPKLKALRKRDRRFAAAISSGESSGT